MPWNLIQTANVKPGFRFESTVTINTGQWVGVTNQDFAVDEVHQWGVIQVCPALPNLFGARPVLDQHLCFNIFECVYGSSGVGTGGRIQLYITKYTTKATIPISIYRWS